MFDHIYFFSLMGNHLHCDMCLSLKINAFVVPHTRKEEGDPNNNITSCIHTHRELKRMEREKKKKNHRINEKTRNISRAASDTRLLLWRCAAPLPCGKNAAEDKILLFLVELFGTAEDISCSTEDDELLPSMLSSPGGGM